MLMEQLEGIASKQSHQLQQTRSTFDQQTVVKGLLAIQEKAKARVLESEIEQNASSLRLEEREREWRFYNISIIRPHTA